ncbi:response regulator [Kovacikia minuta]|uniref:response regulator n=1 Tax=Kovacikia minuta TaxID=2931930 RepID=UPI0020C766A6|nr:response regulator [Kovacikia minuta]
MGYMLIQQVRTLPPDQGESIPTIALTAYAAESDQQRALQAGFQRHITKPVDAQELVNPIVELMQET